MNRSSRRGFTLIELLVVIAIIAVLIALLHAGRPGGARSRPPGQCVNQLKQLGLATHNYHSTNDKFPPGGVCTQSTYGCMGAWNGFSSIACMLPFMEQNSVYSSINFSITAAGESTPPGAP